MSQVLELPSRPRRASESFAGLYTRFLYCSKSESSLENFSVRVVGLNSSKPVDNCAEGERECLFFFVEEGTT